LDESADQVREGNGMPDPEADLRATSESIQDDAEQLKALEEKKSALDPSDPLVVDLSHQIEALVRTVSTKARAETQLSEEIRDA
jgi:hypothetical protein